MLGQELLRSGRVLFPPLAVPDLDVAVHADDDHVFFDGGVLAQGLGHEDTPLTVWFRGRGVGVHLPEERAAAGVVPLDLVELLLHLAVPDLLRVGGDAVVQPYGEHEGLDGLVALPEFDGQDHAAFIVQIVSVFPCKHASPFENHLKPLKPT